MHETFHFGFAFGTVFSCTLLCHIPEVAKATRMNDQNLKYVHNACTYCVWLTVWLMYKRDDYYVYEVELKSHWKQPCVIGSGFFDIAYNFQPNQWMMHSIFVIKFINANVMFTFLKMS